MCDSVLGQLGFEVGERIGFETMLWAGDKGLARIGAYKAVACDAFVGCCGFEEEGELGAGA